MPASFGTQFRDTSPLTDAELDDAAYVQHDEVAWTHEHEHTYQQPDENCPHCYWAGWLAYLDPFAERIGRC